MPDCPFEKKKERKENHLCLMQCHYKAVASELSLSLHRNSVSNWYLNEALSSVNAFSEKVWCWMAFYVNVSAEETPECRSEVAACI